MSMGWACDSVLLVNETYFGDSGNKERNTGRRCFFFDTSLLSAFAWGCMREYDTWCRGCHLVTTREDPENWDRRCQSSTRYRRATGLTPELPTTIILLMSTTVQMVWATAGWEWSAAYGSHLFLLFTPAFLSIWLGRVSSFWIPVPLFTWRCTRLSQDAALMRSRWTTGLFLRSLCIPHQQCILHGAHFEKCLWEGTRREKQAVGPRPHSPTNSALCVSAVPSGIHHLSPQSPAPALSIPETRPHASHHALGAQQLPPTYPATQLSLYLSKVVTVCTL